MQLTSLGPKSKSSTRLKPNSSSDSLNILNLDYLHNRPIIKITQYKIIAFIDYTNIVLFYACLDKLYLLVEL